MFNGTQLGKLGTNVKLEVNAEACANLALICIYNTIQYNTLLISPQRGFSESIYKIFKYVHVKFKRYVKFKKYVEFKNYV